jgi:DNA invertase Pin-like site-specific DNA recombinase
MNEATKAACAYIRVSTTQQGKSGLGLDAQQKQILAFARSENFKILTEFVEVESGKGDDASMRPQLVAALAFAKKHKCPVIVAKLDRLSRDVVHALQPLRLS